MSKAGLARRRYQFRSRWPGVSAHSTVRALYSTYNGGTGTFFEGAITIGNPPGWVDDSIQANIVAARYGDSSPPVLVRYNAGSMPSSPLFKVSCSQSGAGMVISYSLPEPGCAVMTIVDQRGRRIAVIVDGAVPAGRREAVWDAKRVTAGVYIVRIAIDGRGGWTGKKVIVAR